MSTDKYTDITFLQFFQHRFCLCGRTCTAQIFHPARQSLQTFAEGLEMLISKHRGRHQNCNLLIVRHRLKSCPDSHFRFSKAYIPTDETVHWAVALHIGLHIDSSFALIGCIFINKRRFQLTLQETVGTIRKAFLLTTLRIQLNQIAGNILDFGFCTLFQFLPCPRSQLIKAGSFALLTFIFRDLMQRMNRDKHHILILKNQFQNFLRSISIRNTHQSGKTSDTVVRMHHIITRSKLIQFFQGQGHFT